MKRGERVLILAPGGFWSRRRTRYIKPAISTAPSRKPRKPPRLVLADNRRERADPMRESRLARFPAGLLRYYHNRRAHHAVSDSYQRILQHFSGAKVLRSYCDPDRGDMKNLSVRCFDSLAYEYTLPRAIREGYLCPIKALTIPLNLDLTRGFRPGWGLPRRRPRHRLDPYLYQIADEMQKSCADRKTVVFLPLVKTFAEVPGYPQRARIPGAAEVNGNSDDRAEILRDFEAGKYNVLCNSMLPHRGLGLPPLRGLRDSPPPDKGARTLLPDGGQRNAAQPRQERPCCYWTSSGILSGTSCADPRTSSARATR